MAFAMSLNLQNDLINRMINNVAGSSGTAGNARLRIYTGVQPETPDGTAGTSTLLVQIKNIGWNTSTSGTASLVNGTSGYGGTAGTSGVAAWGRLDGSSGTTGLVIDGDVGVDYWNVFQINSVAVSKDQIVTLLTADIVVK